MKRFFALTLLCALLLCSCQNNSNFDAFCNNIFISEVSSDALTLNYSLSRPEDYDIKSPPMTLGTVSSDSMKSNIATSENLLEALSDYTYGSLSETDQTTYDILSYTWEQNLLEGDFIYYKEFLSPTIGTQAQLPVLLSEFHFYQTKDYETYLDLISSVPDYLDSIMNFEKEKASKGLFMSKGTASRIIAQCEALICEPDNNILITGFNAQSNSDSRLNAEKKEHYQSQNTEIVMEQIIPAYERMINGLNKLKDSSKKSGGLCSLPNGSEYYNSLVKKSTGSERSISEIEQLLKSYLVDAEQKYKEFGDDKQISNSDPVQILESLRKACKDDFPQLKDENCTIKYVDDSQSEFLSPAFYLTPPLDETSENVIYINRKSGYTNNSLYTTLAHEGYPGHLFQHVYFASTKPDEIRTLTDFSGYSEGWATYAEIYSCKYAGINPYQTVASLCLYGLIDIGVNEKGWGPADIKDFLSPYGITDGQTIVSLWNSMIDEPANYLKYSLGYIEFCELQKTAQQKMGSKYSDLAFHTFVLSYGPAPFSLLKLG